MKLKDIREAALRFRSALEHCSNELGTSFDSFPVGCCGDVSTLLAAYLKDEGFGKCTYVSGWNSVEQESHAWLEKDGIIYDLTIDQFPDRAISQMITLDGKWHSQFANNVKSREDGDFRLEFGVEHLQVPYEVLK